MSGFGRRSGNRWDSATNGFVTDIFTEETRHEGLYHPHSLAEAPNGELLVCASSAGTVINLSQGTVVYKRAGYLRGLAHSPSGHLIIGQSRGRHGKDPSVICNDDDPGITVGQSALLLHGIDGARQIADLRRYGPEVYDIVPQII